MVYNYYSYFWVSARFFRLDVSRDKGILTKMQKRGRERNLFVCYKISYIVTYILHAYRYDTIRYDTIHAR